MISSGAKVLGSITIGKNSKIGAGSVVVSDVPPNSTVVGVPGKVVKQDGERVNRIQSIVLDQIDLPNPVDMDIEKLARENAELRQALETFYYTFIKNSEAIRREKRKNEKSTIHYKTKKEEICYRCIPGEKFGNVCFVGPTVYNYIHIGNARPMIIFDTVRRYFEYKGYEVNYVSNFTDVDDKIIKKANEEGVTATEIAERYIKECKQDMEALNIKPATHQPRATEEIGGMIKMIQTLIKKGHAYEVDGTVYFKTRSFKDYGKLSKKNIDDLEAGHREIKVTGEEGKEDPLDFVLWKPKKEGEIAWDSPWGEGRPGWHIECSEMSKKYIGDTIDIHAGGEDLIFPHHENEIAQSEACNGEKFANYWMHNGFLNINNKKMSKSAGNFFTVREIGEKYPLQVIRFFMLSAHYRTPLNFSDTLVESAKTGLDRILTAIDLCREMAAKEETGSLSKEETEHFANIEVLVKKFEDAMEDDFNTADAVSAIFEIVRESNSTVKDFSADYAKKVLKVLEDLCSVLGIETTKEEEILDEEIEKLIEERQAARKEQKIFARADEIRDQLLEQGIVLKRYKRRCKMEQSLIQKIKEGLYLDGLDPKSLLSIISCLHWRCDL